MKILVLAPYRFDTAPGQRFRIEQWMPYLESQGVQIEFDAFMSDTLSEVINSPGQVVVKATALLRDYLRRTWSSTRAGRYDAVFLHREASMIGPAWIERLITATGTPIVYEFDDAIYLPYVSPANGYISYLKFPQKTASICRLASHVVVGNDVLEAYARPYNQNVTVVPTTIDCEKYQPTDRYTLSDVPVIGWSGSYSSVRYLDVLKPAFAKLAERYKFRVEVIGASTFKMDGVEVQSRKWIAETEVEDLLRIDIGVMPMPDEKWAYGKCALKALQYMALGIPTVVTPVGANAQVVTHEKDGLHATSTEEWVSVLGRLLEDLELRRRLGMAGRKTVETAYSAQVHAPRIHQILKDVTRS